MARLPPRQGTIAMAGMAYFVVVIVAMHVLSPDISPVERPTSEYVTGPYGYLMTSAFVALSIGMWALISGLRRDLPRSGIHRAGLVFLRIFAVALLVAAVFPIDPDGARRTLAGTIHRINGPIGFLSLVVGVNLVSRSLKADERWRSIYAVAAALAFAMIAWFVAGAAAAARETGAGFAQRVLLVTFVIWFFLVASWLRMRLE